MGSVQDDVCDDVPVDFNEEMSVAQLSSIGVAELISMGVTVLDNVLVENKPGWIECAQCAMTNLLVQRLACAVAEQSFHY